MGTRAGGRRARSFPYAIAVGCALVLASVASAGTITGPGGSGAVKAKGLTAAERKAIDIVSVQATGVEPTGIVVTATFRGNVEQMLGRGHLKTALVALILRPKDASFQTADVATTGAGAIGQTLTRTRSTDVGVVRNGRKITFFVGGTGFGNVGKIDVKAFAANPAGASRALQAASRGEVTPEQWEKIEEAIAGDEALLPAPTAETSCDELKGMRTKLAVISALAELRDASLHDIKKAYEKAIPELEEDLYAAKFTQALFVLESLAFGATAAAAAVLITPVGGAAFLPAYAIALKGAKNATARKQALRDAIRSAKLDVRLAEALIDKNGELLKNIARLQGQADGLISVKCKESGTTGPPPPPPPSLFTYAFSGLTISFDGPNVPEFGRIHVTVTFSGGGCGNAQSSRWAGTFQVQEAGVPPTIPWGGTFSGSTPALVYTWNYKDSGGTVLGEVQMRLVLDAGALKMSIDAVQTGDIANLAVGTAAAVVAKPVSSCQ